MGAAGLLALRPSGMLGLRRSGQNPDHGGTAGLRKVTCCPGKPGQSVALCLGFSKWPQGGWVALLPAGGPVQLSELRDVICPPSLVTSLLLREPLPSLGLGFLISKMRGVGPRCFSSGSQGWSGEGPCGGGPSPLSRTRMGQGEPLSRKKISLLGPLLLTQLPKSRWGSWGYKERSRALAGVLRSLWKSRASPRDSQCRENTIRTPSPSGGLGCGTAAHTQRGTGSRRSH